MDGPEATMTKLYRAEPYLRQASATITRVEGEWIWLDEPLIFAFAGGQQADRGTIGGLEVLESEALDDGTIRYRLAADHGLARDDSVTQVVDWELRYRIMRVHTATHAAYAAMSEQMGAALETIGSNVHAGKGRLDWALDDPVSPLIAAASERVAEIVGRDLAVERRPLDASSDRWVWELCGDDLESTYWRIPCGGTHVARTGELGRIKLKRKNIGKGKERVEVTLLD